MSCLIELTNITKLYHRGEVTTSVLHGIDLKIQQGELVAIIGSSGSGKSTLMNIVGLLDRQTTGDYWFAGSNINSCSISDLARIRNQQIGFIFQAFFLLPALTVLENVGLPLTYQGVSDELIRVRAHLVLERIGIEHLAERRPRELSGGQQQRVAIARALVGNPSIILADEPTGALDSNTSQEIMNLFIELNSVDGNTIIIITHDLKVAKQCPRIIRIQDGLIVYNEENND